MALYNQGGSLIGGSVDMGTATPTGRTRGSVWLDTNSNPALLKILNNALSYVLLDNTHIAAGAAIAYSKLNLATSIVNADVSASAAVAISKLATLEATEASTTPITDNASAALNGRYFHVHFTLPTTEKFYIITGIEWKNGVTVAGNIMVGGSLVDANPPVAAQEILVALGAEIAQSGASVIQRNSKITSYPIRGGSTLSAWVHTSAGTATILFKSDSSSVVREKTIAYTATPPIQDITAWDVSTTSEMYLKVYYRGYATQ